MAQGKGRAGGRREPVFDVSPPVHVSADDRPPGEKPPQRRRKRKASRKAKRPRRSIFGRLIYWSLVLGLWLGIGVAGVIAWTGAHLPPIQSLEIPKRPPSIQIVDVSGHVLATRGD